MHINRFALKTPLVFFILLSVAASNAAWSFNTKGSTQKTSPKIFTGQSKSSTGFSSTQKGFKTTKDVKPNSSKFGSEYNSNIGNLYARQAANRAFGSMQKNQPSELARPKYFPESDLKAIRNRFSRNNWYRQAARDNDPWGARNRYYANNPPIVVNSGNDSFGPLSGAFLYSLLNNVSSAGAFAYHHERDPDYLKWRAEANELAKSNSDLKARLDQLDSEVKNPKLNATAPDPSWLPAGVPAAATLSDAALKSSQPDFHVCVGTIEGPYYKVVNDHMLPALVDDVNINPVPTKGTTEILEKLASGECDAGFVQGDAKIDDKALDVLFRPFNEYAHLACNRDVTAKSISELGEHSVWIPPRSGARMTWDRFAAVVPNLANIKVGDAVNYEDAILKAKQGQDCLFYMAAPHASTLDRTLNRKDLKFIAIDNPELVTPGGYQKSELSSNQYANTIERASWWSAGHLQTVSTPATFVITHAWKTKYPELEAKLALKLSDLEKSFKRAVSQ